METWTPGQRKLPLWMDVREQGADGAPNMVEEFALHHPRCREMLALFTGLGAGLNSP